MKKQKKAIVFKPLQDIYRLRRKIWNTEDTIDALIARQAAPKNQILSDMPKGGGRNTKEVEEYLIRKEALLHKIQQQREAIYILWLAFLNCAEGVELSRMDITLLRLRYFHGYRWKKCVRKLQQIYPAEKWNENKAFRAHNHLIKRLSEDYYLE